MVKNSIDKIAMTHIADLISLALPDATFMRVNEINPNANPVLIL